MPGLTIHKTVRVVFIMALAASLSACMTQNPFGNPLNAAKATFGSGTSKIALDQGKKYFLNGDYGNAERYFRVAVEKSANDVNAWVGLAASYDHLARFKLSKRAYAQAIELGGRTPVILNNLGYSYLLQGKLKKARRHFLMAAKKAPENTHIRNNLALLRASEKNMAANHRTGTKKS